MEILASRNGIVTVLKERTPTQVVVQERVDLTNPDCPFVSIYGERWVIRESYLSAEEFAERFLQQPVKEE